MFRNRLLLGLLIATLIPLDCSTFVAVALWSNWSSFSGGTVYTYLTPQLDFYVVKAPLRGFGAKSKTRFLGGITLPKGAQRRNWPDSQFEQAPK